MKKFRLKRKLRKIIKQLEHYSKLYCLVTYTLALPVSVIDQQYYDKIIEKLKKDFWETSKLLNLDSNYLWKKWREVKEYNLFKMDYLNMPCKINDKRDEKIKDSLNTYRFDYNTQQVFIKNMYEEDAIEEFKERHGQHLKRDYDFQVTKIN
jgi:hypothetical protein